MGGSLEPVESRTSSADTLVTRKPQQIPSYLKNVVYLSLLVSTLAFTFAVVNYSIYYQYNDVPGGIAPPVIAYLATLPHHGAVLLRYWLERHQSEYIFPFTPASVYAISYSGVSCALWTVSTVVAAINLRRDLTGWSSCGYDVTVGSNGTIVETVNCNIVYHFQPTISDRWGSFAVTLTSSLEMLLIGAVTIAFYLQYRRAKRENILLSSPSSSSSSSSSSTTTKVSA
ncbi:hypothetical protein JR316_0010067 [Psilocybe cubensis]|uniref:MARVEL domain-containing protein n=2 Tax=Psilocybe cubensis TaxID=181762 RepID=A0A8H7XRH1_PSICU|nr:hypothetical protein JR316_0010067 [Psilocybe cubensis]KAH9477835.1 hypothetical protein JR316_0010067 [Psilocybe cubensis]